MLPQVCHQNTSRILWFLYRRKILLLHAACPCCLSVQHVYVTCQCCMSSLHGHAHAPCHVLAACHWNGNLENQLLVHAADPCCTSLLHVHTGMSRLHVPAACSCYLSMLFFRACMSMLHVIVLNLFTFRSLFRAITIYFTFCRFADFSKLTDKQFTDRGDFTKNSFSYQKKWSVRIQFWPYDCH